jgi:neutral ceramidase
MRIISFLLMSALAGMAHPAQLRIGSAAVVITPPLGTPLAGYYETRISDGVHDDLYAKALVLECGGNRAAMVSCDLISMPPPWRKKRARSSKATGLKPEQVMISATHAHTGPILPGEPRAKPPMAPAANWRRNMSSNYRENRRQRETGDRQTCPATASAAIGREEHLSFNRRYIMKDGTVGWNPGKLNPKIDKPAGPIDPAVSVLYFESPDGVPWSATSTSACIPTR